MANSKKTNETPVKLIIDENSEGFERRTRELASFTIQFNQPTDIEGQITGIVRGGKISMRMKVINYGNTDMVSWMASDNRTCSGKIEFTNTTDNKTMKTLVFKNAYCVDYIEHWEDDVYEPILAHWEEITISCKKITIESTISPMNFENIWELQDTALLFDGTERNNNYDY